MSLDERIHQLSDTIIDEVRSPIEAALHRLLADVMALAEADRGQAVQAALADASSTHETALAALREQLGREGDEALTALREQLGREREEALSALRDLIAQQHEAARAAERSELDREREDTLAAQREGFARDTEAALAALREQLVRDYETGTAALRDTLAADHEAALAALRQELDNEREDALAAVRQELDDEREAALAASAGGRDTDAALEALRAELSVAHEAALKAALEAAGEEADRVRRAEIEAVEARAAADRDAAVQQARDEHAQQEASAVSAARDAAEIAATAALTAALHAAQQGRTDAEARVLELEEARAQAVADAEAARQAVFDAEAKVLDADAKVREADAKVLDAEARVRDAETRKPDAGDAPAGTERTLAAFRRLDAARSLTEVLDVLADQAAAEIGRAAILTVHGARLRGWQACGFDGIDAAAIDAPVEPGSVFGMVLDSGLPVSTSDSPLGLGANGLGHVLVLPPGRSGIAVPISVGGRVVAILYADEGGGRLPAVPGGWPGIAEILARHAARRLEVLTVSHAAMLAGRVQQERRPAGWPPAGPADGPSKVDERREEESARRYARLLISEIKLYNEPAVDQGRQNRDLLARLGEDIERARRLYEEKIPAVVRQRVKCFEEELVRTLAGGDPDLLGQT